MDRVNRAKQDFHNAQRQAAQKYQELQEALIPANDQGLVGADIPERLDPRKELPGERFNEEYMTKVIHRAPEGYAKNTT